jgi:exosome complex component MTR3
MPRRPSKLSNCYVPLPLPSATSTTKSLSSSSSSGGGTAAAATAINSKSGVCSRPDRNNNELRQLFLETSIIGRALGSSLVELGHTKVLCEVHLTTSDVVEVGVLDCVVKYAPHIGMNEVAQRGRAVSAPDTTSSSGSGSGIGGGGGGGNNHPGRLNVDILLQESALSHQVKSALSPAIHFEKYPKCTIQVRVLVLQDDGSCLSAAITASTIALVDARVDMYDVVTSSTVAILYNADKREGNQHTGGHDEDDVQYLADPTEEESFRAQGLICLAITPNHKEVTLWSQTGRLPSSLANPAMELCRDGCRTMHKFMREVFVAKHY